MAISDIAAKRDTSRPTAGCTACGLLAELPDAESAVLVDLLSDPRIRYNWLADELAAEGHPIDWQALSRHARGRCAAKTKLR